MLTGGLSSRFGFPKALLPVGGTTFLASIVANVGEAGLGPVVVVTGAHDAEIRAAHSGLSPAQVTWVLNPEPARGQLSSLKCAVRALAALGPDVPDAMVVALVDQPLVRADTIAALVEHHRLSRAPVVRPASGGRHGHPVLFARATFEALLGTPDEDGARAVVRALGDAVLDVDVMDEGVVEDIDTVRDYERLVGPLPAALADRL